MIAIVCNTDKQFKQLVKNSGKQREVFICVQPESDVSQLEFDQFTVHPHVRVSTTFFKQMTDRIQYIRKSHKTENLYTPNCIRTYTGKYFDPFNPDPDLICIEDIAHALSMTPRFGGHMPVFYSVAQHCTEGAKRLLGKTGTLTLLPDPTVTQIKRGAMEFLLHDASEAYLGDLPSPIKNRLPGYKVVEDNLQMVICHKFGLQYPHPPMAAEMDREMLEMEWEDVFIGDSKWETAQSPTVASMVFLRLFKELTT